MNNDEFNLYPVSVRIADSDVLYYIYAPKKIKNDVYLQIVFANYDKVYNSENDVLEHLNRVLYTNTYDKVYLFITLPLSPDYNNTFIALNLGDFVWQICNSASSKLNKKNIKVNLPSHLIIENNKFEDIGEYIRRTSPYFVLDRLDKRNELNDFVNFSSDSSSDGSGPGLAGGPSYSNTNSVSKPKMLVKLPPKPYGFTSLFNLIFVIILSLSFSIILIYLIGK